jgi:hypothetical protein
VIRAVFGAAVFFLVPSPALACGGMFCGAVQPVDQAAERIVFAWAEGDEECPDGTVTVEVQISYTGDADDFAWVVPVPDVPELFVSNDALFTVLANATVPFFTLQQEDFGTCDLSIGCADQSFNLSPNIGGGGDYEPGGVNVISSATVGPYETVVLQATGADYLLDWLDDQGFVVPSDIGKVVAPYLADHQYFVALKLASDKDVGDLAPLGMTYCGGAASIPIQLTSIAAIPDLPIEAFVFGPSRAVPDNYLHVRINEAAIDWYAGGTNYRDVVKRAADEAGGQAFATDFSGGTAMFADSIWSPGMIDLDALWGAKTSIEWVERIANSSLPPSSQLTALLTEWAPAPAGVDQADFLQCPSCYDHLVMAPFDAEAATAALETEIVEVLEAAQALVDASPHMTRLFTTIDPSEMTVDPQFVFNEDIEQEVAFAHTATNELHCGFLEGRKERVLRLTDGRSIDLPSVEWLGDGMTELEYMEDLASPAAILIEDLGVTGPGAAIADYRADAADEAAHFSGCGRATRQSSAASGVILMLGFVLRRRRR